MKSLLKSIYLLVLLTFTFSACKQVPTNEAALSNPQYVIESMEALSDVIVYDIFSPPVASRNYAYPSIAAYEVLAASDSSYQSLAGQITEFTESPAPPTEEYSPAVAALSAFITTSKNFIFSEEKLNKYQAELFAKLKNDGISNAVFDRSIAYGDLIAAHVIEYSQGDNYKQSRTFPKYSITSDEEKWKPTPPGYMDGIEPHWSKIRPFVIDSAQQFIPQPPTKFDLDENSQFYKETIEVYEIGNSATEEQKEIAAFWDCNPYKLNVTGHVMHATKKITPGGHWIGIIGIVCQKDNASWGKTIEAYTLASITMADAFISCWDEKYRSNLIRPETVINEHIDESWTPYLQTPPFPEHTSGHSVVSRSAAVALTSIFGENFAYDDTVELAYGLPKRSYRSFYHASEEAAISRLYGGIHYRPAIDYGVTQGEKVGLFVVNNVKLKS